MTNNKKLQPGVEIARSLMGAILDKQKITALYLKQFQHNYIHEI